MAVGLKKDDTLTEQNNLRWNDLEMYFKVMKSATNWKLCMISY